MSVLAFLRTLKLSFTAVLTSTHLHVVSVRRFKYPPNWTDDWMSAALLSPQSSLWPQLGLPAPPGLGQQQGLHLARIQLGGPRPSGAPSGPDGGGKTEALSRSRLDWQHRHWVCFNMQGVAESLTLSNAPHFLHLSDCSAMERGS